LEATVTSTAQTTQDVVIRPLTPQDLDAVVALDRRSLSTPRRAYFEKRLDSALRWPRRHLQLAATTKDGLVGFLLARMAGGEYGRPDAAVVLETVGVEPGARHGGLGQRMVKALEALMRERNIKLLVTQVEWRNHLMLKFLDGAGFTLAPRLMVERPVARMPLPSTDEEIEKEPPLVRHLKAEDFAMVVRIDKLLSGQDRSEYFRRKFDEVLKESAIEVSLVAESDGFVVAFAMARVDFGDFGHVEATASLDTIGVNPSFAHQGFAQAILGSMVHNLSALHVEHLETEVQRDSFDLLRFLYTFGFGPSQRLVFQKTV
jgi:ribosomal protein S18 acetylase RimI-like enzyme